MLVVQEPPLRSECCVRRGRFSALGLDNIAPLRQASSRSGDRVGKR